MNAQVFLADELERMSTCTISFDGFMNRVFSGLQVSLDQSHLLTAVSFKVVKERHVIRRSM